MSRKTDQANPEWSEADFLMAKPAHEVLSADILSAVPRTRGRPRKETVKRQYSVRLDDDVVEKLRRDGPGWQTRLNDILRKTIIES